MRLARQLQLAVLRRMSELEREFSRPGSPIRITKRYLDAQRVRRGESLWIGTGLTLQNHGRLSLADRCGIGANARILNHGSIEIGEDFLAAPELLLSTGTHDLANMQFRDNTIKIGKRVWCGVRVTIIGDTEIGDNSIVAAGAVVKGIFPPGSIIGGVPARVIKSVPPERDAWRLHFQ